jgi:guanylate kinase
MRAMPPSLATEHPLLFIVSGQSGAGKGTALATITRRFPHIRRAATFTTRQPRPSEVEGVDYEFVSKQEFDAKIAGGEIFEYTEPYRDYQYGSPTTLLTAEPHDLVVELDYRGMLRTRALSARRVVSLFIVPPRADVLASRIGKRHLETNLDARMVSNREQSEAAWAYDYVLENDDPESFERDIVTVIAAEHLRRKSAKLLADLDDRLVLSTR